MDKALLILGVYVIIFGIAGIEIYFKLKKRHNNDKKKDEKEN